MTIGIALKYEDLYSDDMATIKAYASDNQWLIRTCIESNVRATISFSRTIVSCALIAARHESKEG